MAIQELGEKAVSFTGPQIGIVTDSTHRKARIKKIDTQRLREALDGGQHRRRSPGSRGWTNSATSPRSAAAGQRHHRRRRRRGDEARRATRSSARSTPTWTASTRPTRGSSPTPARWTPSATTRCSRWRAWARASCTRGSIEFAKKFDVPLMVRNSRSDAVGTWIVPEADWMSEIPVCGAALAADEARLVLEGVPDRPGVSHRVFAALAGGEHRRGHDRPERRRAAARRPSASPCSTPNSSRRRRRSRPIVAELGATLDETGKVSKVSVVGAGMRTIAGVAERMFQALAAEGVNMKMITTGDIKISVLVEEDVPEEDPASTDDAAGRADQEGAPGERARRCAGGRRCGRSTRRSAWPSRARGRACRHDRAATVPAAAEPAGRARGRRTARRPSPGSRAWRTCSSAAST